MTANTHCFCRCHCHRVFYEMKKTIKMKYSLFLFSLFFVCLSLSKLNEMSNINLHYFSYSHLQMIGIPSVIYKTQTVFEIELVECFFFLQKALISFFSLNMLYKRNEIISFLKIKTINKNM